QMTETLGDRRGVRFENRIEPSDDLPNIACDFVRAKQCLINLVNNAFKYNSDGGTVWIAAHAVDGERVRFLVGDTGIGIPEDRQHELFRPFSRLGRDASNIEGSGVGLAL